MRTHLLAPALALMLSSAPVPAADTGPMSPAERGAATRAFVKKWAPYIQRVEGIPARVWAMRMVPTFTQADPDNLRRALVRDTLEGALAELVGRGERLGDEQVITAHALAGLAQDEAARTRSLKALGSINGDLVYTPVTPCRVADTRIAGGAIAAGGSRSVIVVAISAGTGFGFQGGSSTDCGVAAVGASAVAINVTAVTPANVGFATVYRYGDTRPLAAGLTYTAGQIINNTVIVGIPNPLSINDVTIYSSAQSHYVVDIVGYFSPPAATSLQCLDTVIQTTTLAAGASTFVNNPSCPAGYLATMPYCYTNSAGVVSRGSGTNSNTVGLATFCAWHNTTASSQDVFGGSICCRIPGK